MLSSKNQLNNAKPASDKSAKITKKMQKAVKIYKKWYQRIWDNELIVSINPFFEKDSKKNNEDNIYYESFSDDDNISKKIYDYKLLSLKGIFSLFFTRIIIADKNNTSKNQKIRYVPGFIPIILSNFEGNKGRIWNVYSILLTAIFSSIGTIGGTLLIREGLERVKGINFILDKFDLIGKNLNNMIHFNLFENKVIPNLSTSIIMGLVGYKIFHMSLEPEIDKFPKRREVI